ncbi:MAG: hypothetical protein D3906_16325, partial [Candidatus Electrothrix sp. AUS1_2]|nr:hypothetical protein [Candidatus Electrothrix sp. AUS1_2]
DQVVESGRGYGLLSSAEHADLADKITVQDSGGRSGASRFGMNCIMISFLSVSMPGIRPSSTDVERDGLPQG